MSDRILTRALCWRVERRDGVAIGLTEHDRDLRVDGLLHRAAPGMRPSTIVRSEGLKPDTMSVEGALASPAITEADLLAGRWDGARVALFLADWESGETIELGEGAIGAVEVGEGGFSAELRGAAAVLDRPAAEATAPSCRAELGDLRCRVPMRARRRFARVVSVMDTAVTLDAAEPSADAYGGGLLRWFGGANAGMVGAVARSAGSVVELAQPPRLVPAAGDLVEIVEGCDKRLETCAGRFGNAVNFRGEPYLPGVDLLTRYPGA